MSNSIRRLARRDNYCLLGFAGLFLWAFFALGFYSFLAARHLLPAFVEKCFAQCSSLMTFAFSTADGVRLSLALGLFVLFLFASSKSLSEVWRLRNFTRSALKMEVSPRLGRILQECGLRPDRVFFFLSRASFACTAGLFSPRIYVSRGLIDSLSDEEIKAVLLHENSHLKRRDPLRGVLIGFFSRFFSVVPMASCLIEGLRRDAELIADDQALSFSHSPAALASALVKVRRENLSQPDALTGFTDGDILWVRLNRILGLRPEKDIAGGRQALGRAAAGLILFFSFIFLIFPTDRDFPKAAPWRCHHADHATCCPSGDTGAAHAQCGS